VISSSCDGVILSRKIDVAGLDNRWRKMFKKNFIAENVDQKDLIVRKTKVGLGTL